jgi:hypothetical protein
MEVAKSAPFGKQPGESQRLVPAFPAGGSDRKATHATAAAQPFAPCRQIAGRSGRNRRLPDQQLTLHHVHTTTEAEGAGFAGNDLNHYGLSREIFAQPFPTGDGKWKISTAGGTAARWRGDSKELYYVAADNKMMSVAIKASMSPKPSFEAGTPQALFDSHMLTGNVIHQYDVTSDGKRFLINTVPEGGSAPELNVVVNWRAGAK